MKKIILISFILSFASVLLAQNGIQDTVSFITKEYYLNDFIYYKNDTFLVVHHIEEYKSDQMISEKSDAYLFEIENGVVEQLVGEVVAFEDVFEGEPIEKSVKDYAQNYISDLYFNEEEEDYMNDMLDEDYNSNSINVLKSNVIEILSSSWSYAGGAHGYGIAEYSYFDLDKKDYFNLLDCYNEEVLDFIYDKVKIAFFQDDELGGPDIDEHLDIFFKDLDQRTLDNRDLGPHQYYFSKDGLHVEIQMYDTLYEQDEFYIGYNNWEILIPYNNLNKFLIKDSAIFRMLEE